MTKLILYYVLGALMACGTLTIWFNTHLPLHLFKAILILKEEDEVFTWDDWQLWLEEKNAFFGELLGCPLCSGFWVSVAISTAFMLIHELSPLFIPACALSWPLFIFFTYKHLSDD
jgi:hypothetical protein